MFHNYAENSTGEPPTPPLTSRTVDQTSGQLSASRFFEPSTSSMVEQAERGRSETIPSHDSGYEMSPNLNRSDSQEFFTELEVFDADELCSECGDEFCQCLRSHSSRTTVRSPATPSNVLCDMYFYSESSLPMAMSRPPPSSLPMDIPRAHARPSTALPSMSFSQRRHSSSMPAVLQIFQEFLSRSQPRMWPATLPARYTEETTSSTHRGIQYVDSLSSFDSTTFFDLEPIDGVCDDEVFGDAIHDMVDEDVPFHPNTDYRRRLNSEAAPQPLPDLLLHASPRRNRSASVNLPPDHAVLRDIGRSLRRISDDFQTRMSGHQQSNDRRVLFNNHLPGFKFLRKSDHP